MVLPNINVDTGVPSLFVMSASVFVYGAQVDMRGFEVCCTLELLLLCEEGIMIYVIKVSIG